MEPASQLRERTARFRGVPVERGGSRACVSIYGKSVEESDIGVPSGVWRDVSSIKEEMKQKTRVQLPLDNNEIVVVTATSKE